MHSEPKFKGKLTGYRKHYSGQTRGGMVGRINKLLPVCTTSKKLELVELGKVNLGYTYDRVPGRSRGSSANELPKTTSKHTERR